MLWNAVAARGVVDRRTGRERRCGRAAVETLGVFPERLVEHELAGFADVVRGAVVD